MGEVVRFAKDGEEQFIVQPYGWEKGTMVKVYDPKADYSELSFEPKFIIANSIEELSINADILVLLTEWPRFKKFDWPTVRDSMKTPIIFDAKNFLIGEVLKENGFNYYSIGR